MANIKSLAAAWKDSCSEYQGMVGKAAPVEAVKKCWLRSNKTLTVTLQEFDAAYDKFDNDQRSLKTPVKTLQTEFQAVKKKHESVKKMAPAHLAELEEEYIEAHAGKKNTVSDSDQKIHTKAVKFLKEQLKALLAVAENRVSECAYILEKRGTQIDGYAQAATLFEKRMTANIGKGKAVLAKLKAAAAAASKTPAALPKVVKAFNESVIQAAGRDINVIIVGLLKYCEKTNQPDKYRAPVQAFYDFTKPWNDPNTHRLPADATAKDLQSKLKEFADMLKKAEIFTPRVMKDI